MSPTDLQHSPPQQSSQGVVTGLIQLLVPENAPNCLETQLDTPLLVVSQYLPNLHPKSDFDEAIGIFNLFLASSEY